MKHILLLSIPLCTLCLLAAGTALAWDGFDAETTALIAITPDQVPTKGDTVDVRNYEDDSTETCLVESVRRNKRTIEVVVRTPQDNKKRTLVMESL
ncbi:MAG: DUF5334 family protein [Desulfovibrionaceae bacterium]